jgi:hypothetical protein
MQRATVAIVDRLWHQDLCGASIITQREAAQCIIDKIVATKQRDAPILCEWATRTIWEATHISLSSADFIGTSGHGS